MITKIKDAITKLSQSGDKQIVDDLKKLLSRKDTIYSELKSTGNVDKALKDINNLRQEYEKDMERSKT